MSRAQIHDYKISSTTPTANQLGTKSAHWKVYASGSASSSPSYAFGDWFWRFLYQTKYDRTYSSGSDTCNDNTSNGTPRQRIACWAILTKWRHECVNHIIKLDTNFHSATFNWCCWCNNETQLTTVFWGTLNFSLGWVEIVSMFVVIIVSEEILEFQKPHDPSPIITNSNQSWNWSSAWRYPETYHTSSYTLLAYEVRDQKVLCLFITQATKSATSHVGSLVITSASESIVWCPQCDLPIGDIIHSLRA